jgi:uncharacterized YigZ family protein
MPETRQRLLIPGGSARAELIIERSRFIASAGPAFDIGQARDFIANVKREYPDASHHVPAFVIGHGLSVTSHCGDDGEPAGTAGRPALAVLQGSGLGDAVVVVTRYWGGIKLGTGGLVHAYSDAVKEVLCHLPRAEKVATVKTMLVIEYSFLERVRQISAVYSGRILEEDFAADITLVIEFREENFQNFQKGVKNLTRGAVEAIIIERDPNSIMPFVEGES